MAFRQCFLLLLFAVLSADLARASTEGPIARLQAYLRVRTDHGQPAGPDYFAAETFLNATIASHLPQATVRSVSLIPGKPILIATIAGSDSSLPSLLLNSHTDVVPAEASHWTSPPFEASIISGKLYARGSQDMKSVGMGYLEALSSLCVSGWRPARTIHVTFVPDEEIGGRDGMRSLVRSPLWKELNVGAALDEGVPHPEGKFHVLRGERQSWSLLVDVAGAPGHGATLPGSTAVGTLMGVIARVHAFRDAQVAKVAAGAELGDVVNVNVAFLEAGIPDPVNEAGYVINMIPSLARAGFDIRVPPGVPHADVDADVVKWLSCGKALCQGVSYRYVRKSNIPVTTDLESPSWPAGAFFSGLKSAGIQKSELQIGIFPAATDVRYVRAAGVPGIGFSPMRNTPNLLHKHDEFIFVDSYLEGIQTYKEIIRSLAGSAEDSEQKVEL